ncbi:ribosomal protein S3, partial [Tanacetum coccineum]
PDGLDNDTLPSSLYLASIVVVLFALSRQLKNRVSFRKAMKKAIELTEQADTKGIQVDICLTQAFRSHFLLKEDRKKLKVEKEADQGELQLQLSIRVLRWERK